MSRLKLAWRMLFCRHHWAELVKTGPHYNRRLIRICWKCGSTYGVSDLSPKP